MSVSVGDKLGPYEIVALLGTGGMGEVYRARDTRLNREVAVKVSAERFTERFDREARAIASLNHPNICHLYDVGPNYLVMELVDGPTLAERIKQGAIPLEEALTIAGQIADALEAAHEKGITHRDLKPGNINIKSDGTVKVLDFGLAKMGGTPTLPSDQSPTITVDQTEAGVILGTAAYMAPEQAKGKPVDKRADIWAFGVVLYEMLTGRRLFHGESTTEVLASVIKEEPDWNRVPAKVRPLLRRCLEKDPKRRLHDIADAMPLLELMPDAPPAPRPRLGWLGWSVAGLFLLTTAALGFLYVRGRSAAAPEHASRFQIPFPEKIEPFMFSVSPDGRQLVFTVGVAVGGTTASSLWMRALDSLESHPLPGTEGAVFAFWSPDSKFIAFSSQGKLRKMDVSGGPAETICDGTGGIVGIFGGSWNRDNVIIFSSAQGLMRVSASGGTPSPITVSDRGFTAFQPTFLPDGRHFLYFRVPRGSGNAGVYAGSLDGKPQDQSSKPILATPIAAAYVPSEGGNGRLLFLRDGTLVAQTLDSGRLELTGEAVSIAEGVGSFPIVALGYFSASANGVLVYRGGGGSLRKQPTWYDRQGKVLGTVGEPGNYSRLLLSPDMTRAAFTLSANNVANAAGDIWVLDLVRNTGSRLTFDGNASGPTWSPDSNRIAFLSSRNGSAAVYQKAANGSGNEELLLKSVQSSSTLYHWSVDGRFLLSAELHPQSQDLLVLPLSGDRKPIPFVHSEFIAIGGSFSPDGRWIAYRTNETGRFEVYVQAFNPDAVSSPPAGRSVVSKGGTAGMIRWRADGKELFYLAPDGTVMSVETATAPGFRPGEPKALFKLPAEFMRSSQFPGASIDVTADGKRVLAAMPAQQSSSNQFTVVLNWTAGLKK